MAVGGAVGGPARYGLEALLPTPDGGVPRGTLLVNLTGAALLGVVSLLAARRWRTSSPRLLLGVGFLGSFTTFSTLVLQVDELRRGTALLLGLGYGLGSVGAGLLLAALAVVVTERLTRPPPGGPRPGPT